jgi:4-cresol dehydrogenase (hydroxylating) flavoprotein subunit
MKRILPAGISGLDFDKALREFTSIVGSEWVLNTDQDRDHYQDFFAIHPEQHHASGAVAPITTQEVQDVIKVANRLKIPLWVTSRGKNFGYGSAAPVVDGSVVLDLTRMKKIEMDVENGTILIEPGVSFYDLYEYIESRKLPYWLSVPGNSWGSVVGNALERGVGYTPYGDHAARIHGMEVILPDGDIVRTGMGAMANSTLWQLHPHGFGPNWDSVFVQSNFGVVTRMGLWLMPAPESVVSLDLELQKPDDLGVVIDVLAPFRREGLIQQSPTIGNWLRAIAGRTLRSDWYDKPEPFPADVIAKVMKTRNIGWWSMGVNFYGRHAVTTSSSAIVKKALQSSINYEVKETTWSTGDKRPPFPPFGVPYALALKNAGWYGGRGGHLSFSPVLPQSGSAALQMFHQNWKRFNEFGFDFHPAFNLGERHLTNINQILFDRDDLDMRQRADQLFKTMVSDAHKLGYGEYRAHISYMDLIADTFDFNDNSMQRLNNKVKNALDPNGILSAGKNGIWSQKQSGDRS